MKTKRILVIVVMLLAVLGAYSIYSYINKEHPDYTSQEADAVLAAQDLYNQFVLDSEKASLAYNGKVIQVDGSVHSVEQLDSLTVVVFVFEEGMFGPQGVRCTLNDFTPDLNLSKESAINVKGYCTGFNDTDVIIEKCIIIP